MTMRLIRNAAAISEFVAGYNGDCGECAEMALLHVINPAAYPLDAGDLSTIVKRDISHGWASANGSEPISAIANDLATLGLHYTNYGFSQPAAFDWRGQLAQYGGIKPIVFEYSHAGAGLPGDEPNVDFHFNCCLGWDPAAGAGLFADGDNVIERTGGTALVRYTAQELADAGVCGMLVGEYLLGGAAMLDVTQTGGMFTQNADGSWRCVKNGHTVSGSILNFYRSLPFDVAGCFTPGLPISEMQNPQPHLWIQIFERGALVCDPGYVYDRPPGTTGDTYFGHVDTGLVNQALSAAAVQTATAPLHAQIAQLQAQIQQLQATPPPAPAPAPAPDPAIAAKATALDDLFAIYGVK